ncbi:uncharacterized protein BDV17DRAFT_63295 [Aspergillus undulatus]|uniref:uncharacterized protein n=1 Tax=Aspergillus undulatus TaxID=1810928 RepID=UPI003CCE1F2C
MVYSALLLSLGLAAPIVAQSNYTFPAGFDINQVELTTRSSWCRGQLNNCPKICGGSTKVNRCEADTLDFTCTCSNGTDADVSLYADTVPFYVCQEEYKQCIDQSSTQDGDQICTDGLDQCGSLNASAPTTTSSTSSSSEPTSTETSASTSDNSDIEPTATDTADEDTPTDAAVQLMQNYGLAGFATVVVAAFSLL